MNERTFYIPVEMEAVPAIEKKIDFFVDEKFEFAHPEIPPEIKPTLTIKKNNTEIASFNPNDKSDTTANITVPTNVSELENDSGYVTPDTAPVKSVDGKTGEVVVEKVTNIQQDLDCTYKIFVNSVDSNGIGKLESFTIGGTKTLYYMKNKIYKDATATQEADFPSILMAYANDYMGWDVQVINFSDIVTSQEIKLYKLCKVSFTEISQVIYASVIGSIEFKSSDGSTLIWNRSGEVEIS